MKAYWDKVVIWWSEASPKKRWTAIGLTVGVVCTALFLLITGSPSGNTTAAVNTAERMDNPLYYVGVAAKTIGVLLLIIGGAVILKRLQSKQKANRAGKNLELVDSIRITPKQAIHLVRAGDQCFLVGATDQCLNLISRVNLDSPKTEEVIPQPQEKVTFDSILANAAEQLNEKNSGF